ncbi:NAD-dependent epimerase/dehydratase family protein [Rhodanobacter denitrificans]|uniref:Nucleoside-diphosphate-sugar epimerase n=1 Tax=Rhodanobacter denitrificans TaxID=666685 RepID=M4NKM1_9GAMM|nr:NAD-dependent epimerase/dehydratase family protein [Rhodanobacter denitrificans]AGG90238.1 nucleoside-diphosphate-sugar epimerase [Rhodanobacter denitrificans]UJM85624.1 NAD-dependent epimerase/dehydratase family protein [Rhodanobacter denitrificans]
MTVLVFGGSSQIGHFLLPRLLASGEAVLALSRQPRPAQAGVTWLQGTLPDRMPRLPELSAIISFGPLQGLADWLAQATLADAPRVVATSSMSAESKRDSGVPAERALARRLRDGEAALAAACERHGCAWTVLRPTLVYGAGLDKSLTPIARRAMRLRLFPLPSGRGLRQPVHADDIAQAVLAALECPAAAGRILPIGGGERLRSGEMFARVRRSLPRATVPLPLPAWLLRLGQRALPPLRGPLSRLDSDLVADNGELQRLLGMRPRPFRPDAAMWQPPA